MVYVPELTSEVDNTNFIEHDIFHSISYEMKGITCDRSFVRCMILHSLMVVANRNVLSWHKKQNESIWNEYEKRKEHMKRDLFRMKFELEHEDINLTSSWLGWPQIKNELESFENKKLTEVFIPNLFYFSSIRTIWCTWCVLFPFPLCFGVRVCWEIDCIILPLEVVLTHPRIGWAFHTHTLSFVFFSSLSSLHFHLFTLCGHVSCVFVPFPLSLCVGCVGRWAPRSLDGDSHHLMIEWSFNPLTLLSYTLWFSLSSLYFHLFTLCGHVSRVVIMMWVGSAFGWKDTLCLLL